MFCKNGQRQGFASASGDKDFASLEHMADEEA
jgi:hypothetical protein